MRTLLRSRRLFICAAAALVSSLTAADINITDADRRFRAKYGTWPPHVRSALEDQKKNERSRAADSFSKLDRDGDGRLTRSELRRTGGCTCHFDRLDKDGDGALSRSEWHETDSKPGS
jgi:hypothetical protein